MVLPELQGQGIGDEVLRRLVARVDELAPPKAFIGLFAQQASPRRSTSGTGTRRTRA